MEVSIKTAPTAEPVTLAELKNFIKFRDNNSDEDTLITSIGIAAREHLEARFNLSLAPQTIIVTAHEEDFEDLRYEKYLRIPRYPFGAIVSVIAISEEGEESALVLNDGYFLKGSYSKDIVINKTFSTTGFSGKSTYKIEYTCGYGITGGLSLPNIIKQCILRVAESMYSNRGMGAAPESDAIYSLMQNYSKQYFL